MFYASNHELIKLSPLCTDRYSLRRTASTLESSRYLGNGVTCASESDEEGSIQGRERALYRQQPFDQVLDDVLSLPDYNREPFESEEDLGEYSGVRRDATSQQVPRNHQGVSNLEKIRENLRLCSRDHLSRLDCRRWILHDIYQNPGFLDEKFYNELAKSLKACKKGAFLICEHGDHWHVVHDCQYNGSWCRCSSINIIHSAKSKANESSSGERVGRRFRQFSTERLLEAFEKGENTSARSTAFQKSLQLNHNKTTVRFSFTVQGTPTETDISVCNLLRYAKISHLPSTPKYLFKQNPKLSALEQLMGSELE